MRHPRLEEAQAGIKIARRNINNLRYAIDTTLMAESEEELKSLVMKVKEENGKVGLKLNIQKTRIIASGPITSWQIDGETVATVADFILLGSKITADGDCSHEIKRKVMTNLDSILKSREFQKNIYIRFLDYTKAFDCVDHNKLWKILKEMGRPDHLTRLLRNLYAGQEATLELDMEQQTGSK